ncbi:MAG: histidine kinase [Steroidobacteraceae bacterium]
MDGGKRAVLGWPRRIGILACCTAYAVVLCMFPMSGNVSYAILAQWRAILIEVQVLAIVVSVIIVAARSADPRSSRYIAVLMLGAFIGVVLGCLVKMGGYGSWDTWLRDPVRASTLPITYLGVAWIGAGLWVCHQREASLRERLHEEQLLRSDIERQVIRAQMQALQAQIEPHFLFNTLAHLRRLYATQPGTARKMLQDLRHYLDGLQPALQRKTIPLGEDVEYARAYLELQSRRMEQRLKYSITLAPETLQILVPPLAVTTLVENAVKHGIAAAADGGTIEIRSTLSNNVMQLEVVDDGIGLATAHGTGTGLSNLQARLTSTFGPRGGLSLRQRPQGGAVAQFSVPHAGF